MDKLSSILKDSLIFRILIAIGLIVMTLLPLFSEPLISIMLGLSILISGIDLIVNTYISIRRGYLLNQYLLVLISAVVLFVFGGKYDAILTVLVFQICLKAVDILTTSSISKMQQHIVSSDYDSVAVVYETLEDESKNTLDLNFIMRKTCFPVFCLSVVLSVVFAVAAPFIHHLTVLAAIKRALSIFVISAPMTMLITYRVVSASAITESALNGIILSDINSLERVDSINTVILDDGLNYQHTKREVVYSHSDNMNSDSLLNFIYHVVYYSSQDFAKVIKKDLDLTYHNGLVLNHLDIPNYGIKATVNNMRVIFGNEVLCNKFGIDVSDEYNENVEGEYYYLCIADRCVGSIVINEQTIVNSGEIIQSFNDYDKKCIFISDIDEQNLTKKPKLGIFYPENVNKCQCAINYVIENSHESYDASIIPDFLENISMIPGMSNRVGEMAKHNSFISYGIKILLIMLSILGFSTPWISLLVDFGIAIILLMNSRKLYTTDIINGIISLISNFKKKD